MHFTLTIEASNEDVPTGDELARALNQVAAKFRNGNLGPDEHGKVFNSNGDAVGTWEYDR